jgi:hypothetical protein
MKGLGRTEARSIRVGAVRVLKGRHAGRVGYYDDDEGDQAVVYPWGPIQHDHLANVTSLEPEQWKPAHPEVCRTFGIE